MEIPPKYAYHPEGQDILVAQNQKMDFFYEYETDIWSVRTTRELATDWVLIGTENGEGKFLKDDCNQKVLESITAGQTMLQILSRGLHTRAAFGRLEHLVAACFVEGKILFQSRGFNIQTYRSRNPRTKIPASLS